MKKETKGLVLEYAAEGGIFRAKPCGRLDTLSSELLREAFEEESGAAGGIEKVEIDASEMVYVSSAGLRVMLLIGKKASGNSPVTVTGINGTVSEIMSVTGFDGLFEIKK